MDDFAGLIAETEASMRGRLSELRLPSEDESTSPTKILKQPFLQTMVVVLENNTNILTL